MLYTIPYLIFLSFLILLSFWEFLLKKRKNFSIIKIRIIIWISFILFFGFRGFVNTDFLSYYPFFESLKTIWDSVPYEQILSGYEWEPGFITAVYLLKSFIPDYQVWILLWTVILLLSLDFIFLRYVKYYSLAFLLFFVFGGYGICTNLMRASIAMCLFFYSVPCIIKGNWKKFLSLNIVGCLFHISSVIYILSYPVLRSKIPMPLLISIFVVVVFLNIIGIDFSTLLFLLPKDFFGGRVSLLVEEYSGSVSNSLFSIGNIERFGTYLVVCFLYQNVSKLGSPKIFFLNSFVLYFLFFYSFFRMGDVALRLANLFVFSYWIIYTQFYQCLIIKSRRTLFFAILVLYSILKMASGMSVPCHQYKNILWNYESFDEAAKRIIMQ